MLKTAQTYAAAESGGPTPHMLVDMVKEELRKDAHVHTFNNPTVNPPKWRSKVMQAVMQPSVDTAGHQVQLDTTEQYTRRTY